jgi:hypothetical protein
MTTNGAGLAGLNGDLLTEVQPKKYRAQRVGSANEDEINIKCRGEHRDLHKNLSECFAFRVLSATGHSDISI